MRCARNFVGGTSLAPALDGGPHTGRASLPLAPGSDVMKRVLFGAALATAAAVAYAQALPPGPKVTVSAVTQLAPTLPQYAKIDVPMLRDGVAKATNGRVEFNLRDRK